MYGELTDTEIAALLAHERQVPVSIATWEDGLEQIAGAIVAARESLNRVESLVDALLQGRIGEDDRPAKPALVNSATPALELVPFNNCRMGSLCCAYALC